ncbi:MAG: thiol peroxidase [Nitrospiraceae bacterium]
MTYFTSTHIRHAAVAAVLYTCVSLSGCGTASQGSTSLSGFSYKELPVAQQSATPGDGHHVTFRGTPLDLSGPGIAVGKPLQAVNVTKPDLTQIPVTGTNGKGKVRIVSVVPSLDTKVCEQQTHYLSEKNGGLDRMIELITVSVDTPFAQKRFAEEAKISNVTFLSDYRGAEFGKAHGLFLKGPHILARSLMVIDQDNIVRHLQVTPELAQLPDLDDAFRVARTLIHQ